MSQQSSFKVPPPTPEVSAFSAESPPHDRVKSTGATALANVSTVMPRWKCLRRHALLLGLTLGALLPAGCGRYYYGRGGVVVQVPPPQPVYTYQYYYDPGVQAYYCYYPAYGWRYYPGVPPPNAVYWGGRPPLYLPPPPARVVVATPPLAFQFYFDPVRRVYYCHDPRFGWRYYPGHPPVHARFWRGPGPRMLPRPPRGAPFRRPPGRRPWNDGPWR